MLASPNSCQYSLVKNVTSEKNSRSGSARTSNVSDAPSSCTNRAAIHRRIENTPNPTTSQIRPSSNRLPSPVTSALVSCPPNTSGSTTGSRTNAVSSGTPSLLGTEKNLRPRETLSSPNATSTRATPPSSARTFRAGGQSRLMAPRISSTNTTASSGIARLKTSSVAE